MAVSRIVGVSKYSGEGCVKEKECENEMSTVSERTRFGLTRAIPARRR